MPRPPLPVGMSHWPDDSDEKPLEEIIDMYGSGFAGAYHDQEQKDIYMDTVDDPDGARVASNYGFTGSGVGKLSIPYVYAYKHWPECWPCPGQGTGDCVGHSGKNCAIVLIGYEAELGLPDKETGIVEGYPKVTNEAERQGVIACENIYGDRGHRGQGASCYRLIRHVTEDGGIMLRQKYPGLGIDLTRYNVQLEVSWGGSGTPSRVKAEANKHPIRQATECRDHEICRDFLAQGFPIWVCSGYSFSNNRDENGYSKRTRQGWSHSWIIMGFDDRPVTIQKYGFPLALYNHDWSRWNSGGRRILDTQEDIPEGSMWIDARLLDHCECNALAGMHGWDRPTLADYDPGAF